jgi:hypothetical protein
MHLHAAIGFHSELLNGIRRLKFIQRCPGEVVRLIECAPGSDLDRVADAPLRGIYEHLDPAVFHFGAKCVDGFPDGRLGKAGLVEQKLALLASVLPSVTNVAGNVVRSQVNGAEKRDAC